MLKSVRLAGDRPPSPPATLEVRGVRQARRSRHRRYRLRTRRRARPSAGRRPTVLVLTRSACPRRPRSPCRQVRGTSTSPAAERRSTPRSSARPAMCTGARAIAVSLDGSRVRDVGVPEQRNQLYGLPTNMLASLVPKRRDRRKSGSRRCRRSVRGPRRSPAKPGRRTLSVLDQLDVLGGHPEQLHLIASRPRGSYRTARATAPRWSMLRSPMSTLMSQTLAMKFQTGDDGALARRSDRFRNYSAHALVDTQAVDSPAPTDRSRSPESASSRFASALSFALRRQS